VAETPREAAAGAEVVFTMLADDRGVEDVVFGDHGLLAGLPAGAAHVSSSTISVVLSKRLAAAHAAAGQRYVAAPVFGRPDAAAARQLWVLAAGPADAVTRCQPLFDAIGRGTSHLGEEATAANVVKLAGNFLIMSMIEALGEAFAFTQKGGVPAPVFLDVFENVMARSPIFGRYAALIAKEAYEPPGFKLHLGLKDVRLVLDAAGAVEVPMPLASLVRDNMLSALAQGKGELDWSALAQLAQERAGLPSPSRPR
jgi:3-hydroxyisobutyrate dehydrogenase-like beta-hydroxyacid dehydrogenase